LTLDMKCDTLEKKAKCTVGDFANAHRTRLSSSFIRA
jgi:hypothetical protein